MDQFSSLNLMEKITDKSRYSIIHLQGVRFNENIESAGAAGVKRFKEL